MTAKEGGSILLDDKRSELFWANTLKQRKYSFALFEDTFRTKWLNCDIELMTVEQCYEKFINSDYENIDQYIQDISIN